MSERKYKVRTAGDHNFTVNPLVQGRITEKAFLEVPNPRDPKKKEKREYILVDDGETLRRIWNSDNLAEAFKAAEVDDMIRIEFLGKKPTKSGRHVNKFGVQLWSE